MPASLMQQIFVITCCHIQQKKNLNEKERKEEMDERRINFSRRRRENELEEISGTCTAFHTLDNNVVVVGIDDSMILVLILRLRHYPFLLLALRKLLQQDHAFGFSSMVLPFEDKNMLAKLARGAEKAGFKAIFVTVDTSRLGRREVDV